MALTVYSKEKDERNNKGVWREFEGSQLRIAAWLNTKFISNFLNNNTEVDFQELKNKKVEKYFTLTESMAGTILTDWKNVKDDDTGQDVEFSEDLAVVLLRNNLSVYNFVVKISQDLQLNKIKEEEKIEGEL